jgi:hypothetical protein
MPRKYAKRRTKFDLYFEDEKELERRIRQRRRRQLFIRVGTAVLVSVVSTFLANLLWSVHPTVIGAFAAVAVMILNIRPP